MEKQIKTIGVLTSGGDAPGMNAAVRAVVRTGLHKGFRMIGIQRGYNGLLNGECVEMNLRSVSHIISAGGTILYTAIGHSQEIANEIQARTGIDTRATILGHVQRGGSPTLRDRVNASAMGYHAVCLLEQGKYNRIVGMKGEHLVDYPVDEALEMTKSLDPVLVDVCNTISI